MNHKFFGLKGTPFRLVGFASNTHCQPDASQFQSHPYHFLAVVALYFLSGVSLNVTTQSKTFTSLQSSTRDQPVRSDFDLKVMTSAYDHYSSFPLR